jgi:hypothetical protein
MVRLSFAYARKILVKLSATVVSHRLGRSLTMSSSPTMDRPNSSTMYMAQREKIPLSHGGADHTRFEL